jgi:hypothetical protein
MSGCGSGGVVDRESAAHEEVTRTQEDSNNTPIARIETSFERVTSARPLN